MKSTSKSALQANILASCIFGISIPAFTVLLTSFSQPSVSSQVSGCSEHQIYRVSDRACYVLQGE